VDRFRWSGESRLLMRKPTFLFFLACSSIYNLAFGEELSMPIFIPPGDPLLRSSVAAVQMDEILSEETQGIIACMYEIARGERTDTEKRVMVGLAAPQVGIPKRIILVDVGVDSDRRELGTLRVFINPRIVWASEEQLLGREGCFSVDGRVFGVLPRAKTVKIEAFDQKGHPISEEFTGFTARIMQHEIDHLSGIRFPDRIGAEGALQWVEEHQYLEYRKNWQNWPVRCPWNVWVAMKEGKGYEPPISEVVVQ
jgi:peptide deformylase